MQSKRTGNDKMMRVMIAPEDWDALERIARADRTTVSEVVRRHIRTLIVSQPTTASTASAHDSAA